MSLLREIKKIKNLGEIKAWNLHKSNQRMNPDFTYLLWECTLRCNFLCRHCGSNANEGEYDDELNTREAKECFKQLALDFKPQDITVAITGGEPLLRKDIYKMSEYIAGLGFKTGIVTNGYLLNNENIKKIKSAGVRSISISLDGLKETHDKFRGVKGSYKRIMQAIDILTEENFLSVLEVITSVNTINIHELEELYQIIKKSQVGYWRLMEVSEIGRVERNKELLINGKQLKFLLDFIKGKKDELKREKLGLDIFYGCAGC